MHITAKIHKNQLQTHQNIAPQFFFKLYHVVLYLVHSQWLSAAFQILNPIFWYGCPVNLMLPLFASFLVKDFTTGMAVN